MPRDESALIDIVTYARRAQSHLAGEGLAAFEADGLVQDAVVRCLAVIGQAAARLSDDARAARPRVAWPAVIAMRNRLGHDYGAIDTTEVYRTVTEDLPALVAVLEAGPTEAPPRCGAGAAPRE